MVGRSCRLRGRRVCRSDRDAGWRCCLRDPVLDSGRPPPQRNAGAHQVRSVNLLARFLLELAAIAALVFAGSRPARHSLAITLAIAAPCCLAIPWSLFAAHKARFALPRPVKALVGALLLEAAAAALAIAGRAALAGEFAVLILANAALLYLWRQDVAEAGEPATHQ